MSPQPHTLRDELAPLWPEFKLESSRVRQLETLASTPRPPDTDAMGHVLIGEVERRSDVEAGAKQIRERVDLLLASDGALILCFEGAQPDALLARWRNALWPWLNVVTIARLTPGNARIEALHFLEEKALAIQRSATILVARRREQVLSPTNTVVKFDKNAQVWNPSAGSRGYRSYRWARQFVGTFAPVRPRARVLDFGSGAGWCGIEAALISPGASLALFDPSPELAAGAGANARSVGLKEVSVRTGFGEDPPFPAAGEARFDHVISSGVVSFSPDFPRWFDGLARTLAPGATLVIADMNRESTGLRSRRARKPLLFAREMNALTRDEARAQLEARGLRFVKSAGYQLTSPWPEATYVSDAKLGGLLSPLILALNRMSAGDGKPERFDSWVMQFTAP